VNIEEFRESWRKVHASDMRALRDACAAPSVKSGDWLNSLTSAERKECAVSSGLFAYFPDALAAVARHSVRANEKHNPGQPLHWSRAKSSDHGDCIGRHALAVAADPDARDDGQPEVVCRAWRALAALQLWIEAKHAKGEKV
jgi:hypothetical protein